MEKVPKREEILSNLSQICKCLEGWAKSSKPVLPIRVNLLRCAIYGYSVILTGLKDEELELRVLELEKQMENCILVPKQLEEKYSG